MTDQAQAGQYVSALAEHIVPTVHIQEGRIGRIALVEPAAIIVYWGTSAEGADIVTAYNYEDFSRHIDVLPNDRGALLFVADQLERGMGRSKNQEWEMD